MHPPLWEMARNERWDLWEGTDEETNEVSSGSDGEDED
jgi:hypothetical protein